MTSKILKTITLVALVFGAFSVRGVFADSDHETKFTGTVEVLPATGLIGDWTVSGKTIHVTGATRIDQEDGRVAVGATVNVEGSARSDGSIDSQKIEVKQSSSGSGGGSGSGDDSGGGSDDQSEAEFLGTIESLPSTAGFIGDWTVSGQIVHVTSATRIEQDHGAVAVGATVKVEGTKRADGSVDAEEIETRGAEAEPEPEMKFTGTIESLPATAGFIGDWIVSGKTVHVTAATRIETEDGPIVVGAMVEIEGSTRSDGSIDAAKIEVKSNVAELKGAIESLPGTPGFIGDWKVSGKTVHVTASTRIDQEHGAIALGATVEVKGSLRSDGSFDATKIEVKSSSSGPGGPSSEGERRNVKGTIQSLPSGSSLVGDWMVGSQLVHVTSSTRFNAEHGSFAVGAKVKVKAVTMSDGSVIALKVQLKDPN